jgi:hypothetical protein
MTVADWVLRVAGNYGLAVLVPHFFLVARIGREIPPPITHPECRRNTRRLRGQGHDSRFAPFPAPSVTNGRRLAPSLRLGGALYSAFPYFT